MTKVSIIIPVYDVEKYLRECLDSIINQTYTDFEAICVNDGSPDNSLEILKEYAQKDSRIKIINKENGGVSAARNDALKITTGEYIMFVDSDDFIALNTLEEVVKAAEENPEANMVCFGIKAIDERNSTVDEYNWLKKWYHCPYNKVFALAQWNFAKMPGVSVGKLFKSSIIQQKNIQFYPFKYNEDFVFSTEYLSHVEKIRYIDKDLYNYRFRPNSAITLYHPNNNPEYAFNIAVEQIILLYNLFEQRGELVKFNQIFAPRWLNFLFWMINPENKNKENYIEKLQEIANMLSDNYDWGLAIKYIKENRLDKIKQLNIPHKSYKNNFLSYQIFTAEEPYISLKILGIKIKIHYQKIFSFKKADESHKVLNILGVKLKFNVKNNTEQKLKKFIQKIFSIKNQNSHKVINICGLKFKTKKNMSGQELLDAIKNSNQINYTRILKGTARLIKIAQIHQKTFLPHKNSNQGKTLFVCGAGPTLNWFEKSKYDAKYIALNRSFLCDKVLFDYTFSNDKVGLDDYKEEFRTYKGNNCIKFMGDLPLGIDYQMPEQFILEADAFKYFTSTNIYPPEFCIDIDSEPLANFNSVAFQALQFALYTNPDVIYLAGIDNTVSGHFVGEDFDETTRGNDRSKSVKLIGEQQFPKFKEFAQNAYPNTRIISINPVGLRGLFEDVYTRSYLDANPEIAAELGDNIKIFEENEV